MSPRPGARDADDRARAAEEAAAPIIQDLNAHGCPISTLTELYGKDHRWRPFGPLLGSWLPKVKNTDLRETIVRLLSAAWAKPWAGPIMVEEFRRVTDNEDPDGLGLRWAAGNAIEVLADQSVAGDIVQIASDRGYGVARQMVVLALRKLEDDRIPGLVTRLLVDADVAGQALVVAQARHVRLERAQVVPLLNHTSPWVRKEAASVLRRLDEQRTAS